MILFILPMIEVSGIGGGVVVVVVGALALASLNFLPFTYLRQESVF